MTAQPFGERRLVEVASGEGASVQHETQLHRHEGGAFVAGEERSELRRPTEACRDGAGQPSGAPRHWIAGWDAAKGVRPLGTPAAILVDSLGRLLVVEDRNRTVLMLTREAP